MRQFVTVSAFVALLASACALYAVSYDTGRLSQEVGELADRLAARQAEIAGLRAGKASLLRPGRIDRLVKAHLALRPVAPAQLGSIAGLPWHGEAAGQGPEAPPVALQP